MRCQQTRVDQHDGAHDAGAVDERGPPADAVDEPEQEDHGEDGLDNAIDT